MKETLRLVMSLTLICIVSGVLLAWVQEITRAPIAATEARERALAVRRVLPTGLDEPMELLVADPEDAAVQHRVFACFNAEGRWMAVALEASGSGYSGPISVMVGMARDGQGRTVLHDIVVLAHAETPGLGAKIARAEEPFRRALTGRLLGETAWKVRQDGGDIDAVTAATISSRAVLDAVRMAANRLERIANVLKPPSGSPSS